MLLKMLTSQEQESVYILRLQLGMETCYPTPELNNLSDSMLYL